LRTNGHGKPVIALDIDGTLADYHGWFLAFAELYFGRPMPQPEAINPGLPLHRFMKVSKGAYRQCKLAYRQGGMKRSMPCLPGAGAMINRVRRHAEVWICTTRPYLRLDNIDPDTQEWCRRNNIRYDALLFDSTERGDKYRELRRQARGRVVLVAEDLPEQVLKALNLGLRPICLRNRPYNQPPCYTIPSGETILDQIDTYGVWRWDTAEELERLIDGAIEGWNRTRP
jgi:uncharacterized HAD superfamily protein